MPNVARHRTALQRVDLSRPIRLALRDGLVTPDHDVFDYGCGRGGDLERLTGTGITCSGWDPVHRPEGGLCSAAHVNLGYVVNVIEDRNERNAVLTKAWSLAQRSMTVAARLQDELRGLDAPDFNDGVLTSWDTFQKFYTQVELKAWIDDQLGVQAVAAAPGVFHIFRSDDERQAYLASRYQRRLAAPRLRRSDELYATHQESFDALAQFLCARGRLPFEEELAESGALIAACGSLKLAFQVLRRVTDESAWTVIRDQRIEDVLLYIGLSRFEGRPRLSQLSLAMQRDIKAFFGRYTRACDLADKLLFAMANEEAVTQAFKAATVGKQTGNALYVHRSALEDLPPLLRMIEGSARAMVGEVEWGNIIKLHRYKRQVSYLGYPDFEKDPHPALAASLVVKLEKQRVHVRDYRQSENPPILHRKETFVRTDHPLHRRFARLTKQEEKAGLFDSGEPIGRRREWDEQLIRKSVEINGHGLFRV